MQKTLPLIKMPEQRSTTRKELVWMPMGFPPFREIRQRPE